MNEKMIKKFVRTKQKIKFKNKLNFSQIQST